MKEKEGNLDVRRAFSVLFVAFLGAIPAQAQQGEEYPLANSRLIIVQGTRPAAAPDGSMNNEETRGCSFELPGVTLEPGERAVETREISNDMENCIFTFEVGNPPDDKVIEQAPPDGAIVETETFGQGEGDDEASRPAAPGVTHSKVRQLSYFRDPIFLHVNSVQNTEEWWWDRSGRYCIVFPAYANRQYWYLPDGWQQLETDWIYPTDGCFWVLSNSYAHFRHPWFWLPGCNGPGRATDVYYNRTGVYGYWNGSHYGAGAGYKSGRCANMLTFVTQTIRDLN